MSGYDRLAESMARLCERVQEKGASVDLVFGEVVGVEPVAVQVEQRLILPQEVLIFTESVVDLVEYTDEESGEVLIEPVSNLQAGENVILARGMGGGAYVILGRCYAI